jgi:glycosyl transferase family 1
MEKILFITNELFVDAQAPEGGVSYCTKDFIDLLKTKYEVILFPVSFNQSFLYRIKSKLGIDVLEGYAPNESKDSLYKVISENNIQKVFINLSTALAFSKTIGDKFGAKVKIILCSHGIEGGDMLHNAVRSDNRLSKFQQFASSYKLGGTLKKELEYRMKYIDLVLTVSEIESAIEKWIGAKKVFFAPRTLKEEFILWDPVMGRLGFVGDLNHFPNYYGLLQLCEAISFQGMGSTISIRVAGKESEQLNSIVAKYSFVHSLGYLDDNQLKAEAASWMCYLNLVFYYSKGVSTKLAKGMNWGLPVISTEAGNRGYVFKEGGVIIANDADEIMSIVQNRMADIKQLETDRNNIALAVKTSNKYDDIMSVLFPLLESL